MIRTTTRVLGALLIAFLGLSTVHVSAADKTLDPTAFGDTVSSIALSTVVDDNDDSMFSESEVIALAAGTGAVTTDASSVTYDTGDCRVEHFDFETNERDFVGAGPDDLIGPPTTAGAGVTTTFTGVTCEIAGSGAGKILTITIPASTGNFAAQVQGVAKVHVVTTRGDSTATPPVEEVSKVFAQKVLHNVIPKTDAELTSANLGACGLRAATAAETAATDDDVKASMQIRMNECDISTLFKPQVTSPGVTVAYAIVGTPARLMGTGTKYKLTDNNGVIEDVTDVTVTATPTGRTAQTSEQFDVIGVAGISGDAPSQTQVTNLALGQTIQLGAETVDGFVSEWFVLRNQSLAGNEVRFNATGDNNLERDLDVITRFTAVDLSDPVDGDFDDYGEGIGVHATLEIKATGTGTGQVTLTATQGSGASKVEVPVIQKFKVNATEVFKVLSFEMPDAWLENSAGDTDEDDPATDADESRNGLDLLNTAIKGNIKIETAGLDVEYSVSSEPAGLFALKMTPGANPEVDVDDQGAPEIIWADNTATPAPNDKMTVPDYETTNPKEMVVTLTARPAGSNADEENLAVTIGIADDEDDTEFDTTCQTNATDLGSVFVVEGASDPKKTITKSSLVNAAKACASDADDEITATVGAASPACTMQDGELTYPSGGNICAVVGDASIVIHTKAADAAGTNGDDIDIGVTVKGSNDETFTFTRKVVVLTGANTPPRFSGGSSQVKVDAIKETHSANVALGKWMADDVNAEPPGLDEVSHALAGANAMTGIVGSADLGYCLKANAMTGAVSTATCGKGSSAFSGLNFERLTTVVSEATEDKGEVRSFTVDLIASDKFGGTATLEIVVQVENIPEAPMRNATDGPDTIALKEGDDPVTVDLDTYFDDPDGAQLTYSATSSTAGVASVTATADMGVITITAGKTSGSTTITGTVTGPLDTVAGEMAPAPVTFMVTNFAQADNTKPEYANGITSVAYEISEGAAGGTTVGTAWIDSVDNGAADSAEAKYDKLKFEIEGYDEGESPFSVNAMGQIAVVAGKLDYEEKQLEVFYLKVVDSFGLHDSLRVSVSVLDTNEAPFATEYGKSLEDTINMVVVGGVTTLNLRGAFTDPEKTDAGQLLISHELSNPSRLDVIIDEDDVAWLMGKAAGAVKVSLTASDGTHETTEDIHFDVTVVENSAPTVANAIADHPVYTGSVVDVALGNVFTDEDLEIGDEVMVTSAESSNQAAVIATLNDDHSAVTLVGRAVGAATVTVCAEDSANASVCDEFDVHVMDEPPPNNPPEVANALTGVTIVEGGTMDVDLSGVFSDADDDDLTLTAASADDDVASVGDVGDDAMLTVTAGMLGDDETVASTDVTVTADDGNGGTASDTFTVVVLRGNVPPVVANPLPGVTIVEGMTADVDVSGVFTDADGDDLTLSAMTSDGDVASLGEITDAGMMTITAGMLDDDAQSASANVTVKADDGNGGNASDTFTVVVIPDNAAPTLLASIGEVELFQLMDLDVDLSGVFEDPDGDELTLTAISADEALASLGEIGEDQMLTITAGKLNRGQTENMTEVTVTASDGEFEISDTFTVNILRNNTAPVVAMEVTDQLITRGTPITIDVSGVFMDEDVVADPNDDELTLTVMVGDITIVGADLDNGMISLDLEGIAPGMSAVTLTATDLYGGMAETSFEAMVDTRPEAISSISPIALEIGGEGYELDLMTLFRDDDGDTLTYDISLSPSGIANYSMSGMTVNLMPASRGSTTLMVTAADARGYSVSVSGSISVGDTEIRKVAETALAAYARQMITSVDTAVGSRLMSGAQISDLQLASTTNSLTGTQTATASSEDANVMDVLDPNMWTTGNHPQQSQMSGKQGVLNALGLNRQSFAMKLNATEGVGAWSVWGTTDRQNFEGASYDGMASSVYLGVDLQATECFLVGASVARNSGEIDYWYGTAEQSMDTEQTTFLPYFRYDFAPQTSVWGVGGIGSGDVDSTVVGTSNQSSDLDSTLYMFGLRHGLSKMGAIDLALRGDVAMANIETASGDGAVDGLSADVNRIRAGLEGSYTVDMGDGGTFAPFGELSLRNDGGDGDTGTGVEVSGGFRVNLNSFNLEARGRTLASHGADDYEESGFSLTATLNPAADGSGLSFSLAPRWGGSALSTGAIWAEQGVLNQGLNGFSQGNALEARIGYGKRIMGERFMLTPFADFDAGDDVRQYLLGARLDQLINASSSLNVDMAVGRVERRSTGEAGAQVGLNATLRF